MGSDHDTDQLFRCLRQVGIQSLESKAVDSQRQLESGVDDIRSLIKNRNHMSAQKDAIIAPKNAVRLLKDDVVKIVGKPIAYMPAIKPRKTIGFMPMLRKAVANVEAASVTHAPVVPSGDNLKSIAAIQTHAEAYYRRRSRLTLGLDIGLDGLEKRFGIYDRKSQAMFFAQLLETRQFDSFANPQIWYAAKMDKRIIFLNDVLAINARIYNLNAAVIDSFFAGEVPTAPDSAIGQGELSAFDPEQQKILINPPFWHNAVTFEAMIGTVIEQNCRNHVRQLCRLYDGGQLKPDDPRYGQAALFSIQWHEFEAIRQRLKTAEELKTLVTGYFTGHGLANGSDELGFDEYAVQTGEAIRLKLVDLLSGSAISESTPRPRR